MSLGNKTDRASALAIARRIIEIILPYCERAEVAGSLRRGLPEVGDIEIVCVPLPSYDLFGDANDRNPYRIEMALREHGYTFIKNGNRYKKIDVVTCILDLFITTPDRWGVIYTLRTGPPGFSHKIVTQAKYGGYLPNNYHVLDGYIWRGNTIIRTPEEIDVFRVIGMNYIAPEARDILS